MMMTLKELIAKIRPPKEEEIEIPIDWATNPIPETLPPETVNDWSQKGDEKTRQPLNIHKYLVWTAKILFLAYVALSIGFIIEVPFGLILSVPTIAVLIDYIRNDKIIQQISSWWTPPDEHRDNPSEG